MNVVVLAGGTSNEREVSLRSGAAVAKALRGKGHNVAVIDPQKGLESIGSPDVVFPALHGAGGEDGTVQAALETRKLAYVGSGVAASALCWDKWLYRQVLQAAGLPVAKGTIVTAQSIKQCGLTNKGFVLKPIQGGSTLDTYIVREPSRGDKPAMKLALAKYGLMLVEELVEGTELTVAILDEQPLPPVEIIPPAGGDFDYDNKYNGKTQELCPPQNVSKTLQKQAQELALKVHRLTGCRHLSRTDIIVDKHGQLVVLETNTLPGMTYQSLYPKAAATAGMTFADLCERLVSMALARTERP